MSRQFKVTVNGREYDVSVLELTTGQAAPLPVPAVPTTSAGAMAVPAIPATPPVSAGAGDVLAGMGGVVVEVDVKVGQTVAAGDRLLVLEAMKMKTPIIATRAGQITRVLVAPGDAVEGGQPVASIG